MARFKKGERVRRVKDGREGVVKVDDGSTCPRVQFDNWCLLWTHENELELIKGGKMKEPKKVYPKKVYVQFTCNTNADDKSVRMRSKPDDGDFDLGYPVSVYEFKEAVKVEIVSKTKITKVG